MTGPLRYPRGRGARLKRRPVVTRLAAILRGLAALCAVAAFEVGVPAAMVAMGSDPLDTQLPSVHRLRVLLTAPDDGTLLIGAARVVVWAAWAYCTLAVVLQTAAAVAGRSAPLLRGLGAIQRPVSSLVTWITAAVTVPAAGVTATAAQPAVHATPVPTTPPDPAAASPDRSAAPMSDPAAARTPGPAGAAGLTGISSWTTPAPTGPAEAHPRHQRALPAVVVGRYDSLWRIAEEHLGDGRRWVEIYRLNTDRALSDGSRLTDPDHIEEGWTLLLPVDATGTTTNIATSTATSAAPRDAAGTGEAAPTGDRAATRVVVVHSGDTLSGLAHDHLGSAHHLGPAHLGPDRAVNVTQALFDVNAGRLQPDGGRLTDPDLIRPGWRLTLPAQADTSPTAPVGEPRRPAPSRPTTPSPPPHAPSSPAPSFPAPSSPAPSSTATPPVVPAPEPSSPPSPASPTGSPGAPAAGPSAPAPGGERADQDPGGWWVQLPSGSILSLGLVTMIAGLLELVRRRRRQHRHCTDPFDPAQSPPLPAAARAAEEAWYAARRLTTSTDSDPDDDLLDEDELDDDDVLDGAGVGVADIGGEDLDGYFAVSPVSEPGSPTLAPRVFRTFTVEPPETPPSPAGHEATRPVSGRRGTTASLLPAPSLLALVGPPAAAPLAQRLWSGGVGLTGPGAAAVARAVTARLLTASGPMGGELIITSAAVAELLPAGAAERFGQLPGVKVADTVMAAVTACEAALFARARWLLAAGVDSLAGYRRLPDVEPVSAVLLVAHAPDTAALAAYAEQVLQLGRNRELGAVLLGDWPQATLTAAADGILTAPPATGDPDTDPALTPAEARTAEARTAEAEPAEQVLGRAEVLTAVDAAELLTGLLPPLRDALDIIDPTNLLPAAHPPTAPDPTSTPDEGSRQGEDGQQEDGAPEATTGERAAGGRTDAPPVVAQTPAGPGLHPAAGAALDVAVFGRVRVRAAAGDWAEITGLREKVRDLLALLAVHPDGLSTDQVGEALWPATEPRRAAHRLSTTLSLAREFLRNAAAQAPEPDDPGHDGAVPPGGHGNPDSRDEGRDGGEGDGDGAKLNLVPLLDGRYQLHPQLIDTEYRRFTAAVAAAGEATRAGDELGRRAALQTVADLYRGEILTGLDYSWAEPIRERTRRQASDCLAALADLLTPLAPPRLPAPPAGPRAGAVDAPAGASTAVLDPTAEQVTAGDAVEALTALERAIEVDPYDEGLYRRIMRLYAAAGRRDAIRRTLRLLEARLADDIDTDPEQATLDLATELLRTPTRRNRSTGSGTGTGSGAGAVAGTGTGGRGRPSAAGAPPIRSGRAPKPAAPTVNGDPGEERQHRRRNET